MRGGDISNEIPQRVLVTLDCLVDRNKVTKRILGIAVPDEEYSYSRIALATFWRFRDNYEFTLELVGFD